MNLIKYWIPLSNSPCKEAFDDPLKPKIIWVLSVVNTYFCHTGIKQTLLKQNNFYPVHFPTTIILWAPFLLQTYSEGGGISIKLVRMVFLYKFGWWQAELFNGQKGLNSVQAEKSFCPELNIILNLTFCSWSSFIFCGKMNFLRPVNPECLNMCSVSEMESYCKWWTLLPVMRWAGRSVIMKYRHLSPISWKYAGLGAT